MQRFHLLRELLRNGRLALRLLRDGRVPIHLKAIVGLALVYVLVPLDFVPDFIPGLGQFDDLAALAAAIALFIKLCPPELVEQYGRGLGYRPSQTVEGRARPAESQTANQP
jgi:uncharacterized membrane protein YkvA (DUF1232 family)